MARNMPKNTIVEEYLDGRTYSESAVREITQEWVDYHMNTRISEFTSQRYINIFTGTWNVNAKKQEGGLHEWLVQSKYGHADIYAIGFQEIVDLNAMNVALDSSKTQQRATFWEEQIVEALTSTGEVYMHIGSKTLVGLLLCVFVKEIHQEKVSDLRMSSIGVGLMGLMGNKGGVAIRFSMYDSSVVFVCAHLAAHRENVNGRNSDYRNIMEKLLFPLSISSIDDKNRRNSLNGNEYVRPKFGAQRLLEKDLKILEHEIIFFVGDLNYRLEQGVSLDEIFHKIELKEWSTLRDYDQLNEQRAKKHVFDGFSEGILNFAPTYKYLPGSDEYDRRPEKKVRAPAWCDRVLYRTLNTSSDGLIQLVYDRANLLPSDHKPVYAMFNIAVHVVIASKEEEVYRSVSNQYEYWKGDASSIPQVVLDTVLLDFGKVKYDVRTGNLMVKVSNTSNMVAHWRLVPKAGEKGVCKRFLSISSIRGLLLPNETLEDLLVLRVEKGTDSFIKVTAQYERSCFGMSLEDLVSATQPVRNITLGILPTTSESTKLGVPKELWILIDYLWSAGGVTERELFFSSADAAEVALVRDALDLGTDVPSSVSLHAVAEALVSFLSSFTLPIIPFESFPQNEIDEASLRAWSRRFLDTLPPLHYNVFVYVMSFFREILAEKDVNGATIEGFKTVCVNCFTGPKSDEIPSKDELLKKESRLQYLLGVIEFFLTSNDF